MYIHLMYTNIHTPPPPPPFSIEPRAEGLASLWLWNPSCWDEQSGSYFG